MTADTPLAPKLRFPEFRDEPGWQPTTIGKHVDLLSGFPFAGADIVEDKSGTRLLRGINITEGVIRHNVEIDRYYCGSTMGLEKHVLKKGDLVIGMDGSKVGKNSSLITPSDAGALLVQRVARLRAENYTTIRFIFLQVHSPKFHAYVDRINTSSGIPHISAKQINDFAFCLPTEAEQQKVADCLGSLDGLIAAGGRTLEALRQHKQGLMQQLFPQPGETAPRLRFPEFRDVGEWQRYALGKIAEISKGKGISKSDVVEGGRTPCVRYGELYTLYGEIIEIVKSRTNLSASDLVLSKAGDVIIPASGETKEDIATCACVVDDGVALGGDLNVVRSPVDGRFFSYYLNGSRRRELAKFAQGDTVAHLYPTQLSRLEVYIPDEKAEQQRIADCLGSLDGLIAAEVQKLDTLKQHKQGLMQRLFPSPEDNKQ